MGGPVPTQSESLPEIDAIPVLLDNYVWVIRPPGQTQVAVVDPGDAEAVLEWLSVRGYQLGAQVVTHHHHDHTGGIGRLRAVTGAPVYAPAAEPVSPCDHPVRDGQRVVLLDGALELEAISVPGHTAGAMAWTGPGFVCTGDTLFAAGCGRLFEGTPAQMYRSLRRLADLPENLALLCGHEYTVNNLLFARQVEPGNVAIEQALARAKELRASGLRTLPTPLAQEHATNPFLRTAIAAVRSAAESWAGETLADEIAVLAALRRWKDGFRPACP
jgi:hydroxyacylglutathione hydrolase